ncbi:MAG: 4-hydroxy-3-methylbut-2-enyl diphosphate reductase [Crocinitomicaceae bacterium]|nr:4-hydroxy-3-methylbut-2-enyl diphosphate reductase [Crocinitomicaceae bacterium]MCF8410798.1 4-hydroxy-3-methylbut-2-enyl diphosphate reductase [Crocinitomicaceae bacterium]
MKQFQIPEFYRSSIIARVKAQRKLDDPRKKDFSPTVIDFGRVRLLIARHFGFCYGVENAIEIAYRALHENPGKRIYLLSQMIHNPDVNEDLLANGIQFLQDTDGNQLIPFDSLNESDIVLIPAFGTTVQIEKILLSKGIDVQKYNTTCPFVEKVWNRSEKLGQTSHTIIIHGKYNHEETRATFSRAIQHGASLILKDINEAKLLEEYIKGNKNSESFHLDFAGKYSDGFDLSKDLTKIGVVNQTTMLATDTQEITDYLRQVMIEKYGVDEIKNHIADTRDTLCYATNENQSATHGLLEEPADFGIVVGGYNSSNTTHLVELMEQYYPVYFVRGASEFTSKNELSHFDIHSKTLQKTIDYIPSKDSVTIAITSGASCPDAIMDKVIHRILEIFEIKNNLDQIFS